MKKYYKQKTKEQFKADKKEMKASGQWQRHYPKTYKGYLRQSEKYGWEGSKKLEEGIKSGKIQSLENGGIIQHD